MIFGLVFCPLSHPKRNDIGGGTRCIVYIYICDKKYRPCDICFIAGTTVRRPSGWLWSGHICYLGSCTVKNENEFHKFLQFYFWKLTWYYHVQVVEFAALRLGLLHAIVKSQLWIMWNKLTLWYHVKADISGKSISAIFKLSFSM